MNSDRLYDIIKNIKGAISLMDKALVTLETIDDEDMKQLVESSVKQSFLEYFILIESFTSLCLKELKLYKISDDMEKALKKLYQNDVFDEDLYNFLNQYRKYRNRIAHVYKQPAIEEIISFIKINRVKIDDVVDIMVFMYKNTVTTK